MPNSDKSSVRESVSRVIRCHNNINGVLPLKQITSPQVLTDRLRALIAKPEEVQRLYEGFRDLTEASRNFMQSEFAPTADSEEGSNYNDAGRRTEQRPHGG